jgi:hypothetical protein
MGMCRCEKHGDQGARFVSKQIAGRSVPRGESLLKLLWCGLWWYCPVDGCFLRANSIEVPENRCVLSFEDEDRAGELLEQMAPDCYLCVAEYLHADFSGFADLFDEVAGLKVPG